MWVLLQIVLAVVYANLVEWVLHKYVLHGLGIKKSSWFAYHWFQHHKNSRKYAYLDPLYASSLFHWQSRGKELFSVCMVLLVHAPLALYFPYAFIVQCLYAVLYMVVHTYSHLNPTWAKKYLKHHYDHHMGKSQHFNWGVVMPLWDWILGTRKK